MPPIHHSESINELRLSFLFSPPRLATKDWDNRSVRQLSIAKILIGTVDGRWCIDVGEGIRRKKDQGKKNQSPGGGNYERMGGARIGLCCLE